MKKVFESGKGHERTQRTVLRVKEHTEPSSATMGLEEKPGSQSGDFHLIAQAVRMRKQPVWPPSPRTFRP